MKKHNLYMNDKDFNDSNQFGSIAKILTIVVGSLIIFYFLTILLSNNVNFGNKVNNNEQKQTSIIKYDEILAGETFKMMESEYYVLFYNFKASDAIIYSTLIGNYKKSTDNIPLYIVNLSNGLNKNYNDLTSNRNAQTGDTLKIAGPTLIKIKAGRNILYKEGETDIKSNLK